MLRLRIPGHLENVHVVQADLFHLPLRPRSFDMVYSLGVLHHLPEPEAGFREILRYGKPGADVLVYLYWSLNDEPRWKKYLLSLVAMVRRVTTTTSVSSTADLFVVRRRGLRNLFRRAVSNA